MIHLILKAFIVLASLALLWIACLEWKRKRIYIVYITGRKTVQKEHEPLYYWAFLTADFILGGSGLAYVFLIA